MITIIILIYLLCSAVSAAIYLISYNKLSNRHTELMKDYKELQEKYEQTYEYKKENFWRYDSKTNTIITNDKGE